MIAAEECPSDDVIVRLLEGRARAAESDAIDRHVDRCPRCLELLARLGAQHAEGATDDDAAGDDDAPLRPGDRVGRHVIGELLGRGGMGIVYAAYDPVLRRSIAIKLVRSSLRGPTPTDRAHLRREAQAIARLCHPNVVLIHDVGQLDGPSGRLWVAMERVDGVTLRAWALGHPRAIWRERIDLLLAAGDALAAAHDAGIVHRDFKPDNVMIGRDGRVRVLDFGLARMRSAPIAIEPTLGSGRDEHGDAPTRGAIGTPAYMAPEQHLGLDIDARADQFAFAVTAWELLFGERPFVGTNAAAIATAIALGDIRQSVPGELGPLARVLRRALAASPSERYPDMRALLARLRIDPRRRTTMRRLAGASTFALACAGAGLLVHSSDRSARDACRDAAANGLQLPAGLAHIDSRVHERMDRFAEQWRTAELDACLADLDARNVSSTRACHREVAAAWSTAAGVIAEGDATIAARAIEILDELPALGHCAAPQPGRPTLRDADEITRAAVLRERLASVVVLHTAERDREALDEVRAIVDAAREADDEATLADALVRAAEIEEGAGDFVRAEQLYIEGYWLAARLGRDPTAISAATQVAQLVGGRLARTDEARDWVRHAESILARSGDTDPARNGALVLALAAIDHADGRVDAARSGFAQGLELYTLAHGAESGAVATVHANVAAAMSDAGRYEASIASSDTAIVLHTRAWGREHPALARDRLIRGNALFYLGRLDEAEAEYERARDLALHTLAADHPDLVAYYTGLGIVTNAQGRTDDALRWHRRALEIQERSVGPQHADVGMIVNNLGSVLSAAGRDTEAVPYFERSLAIFRHAYGDDHASVGSAQHDLALAHHGLHRETEAIAGYRAAIATWSRVLGERHAMVGRARINLGNALLVDGQHDAAFAEYRLAVEINVEALGPEDPITARAWSRLGLALAEHGRPHDAVEPLRRAIALREGGPDLDRVAELREALASALREP
jgi:tetratricopeptide (TPR) repeat protein